MLVSGSDMLRVEQTRMLDAARWMAVTFLIQVRLCSRRKKLKRDDLFVWLSLNLKGLRPLEIPLEQDTLIIMAACL
jgi:hypothetical protein